MAADEAADKADTAEKVADAAEKAATMAGDAAGGLNVAAIALGRCHGLRRGRRRFRH